MSDLPNSKELVSDIRTIWAQARAAATRSINSELVKANWLIGKRIVEEEQAGNERAQYGQELILLLAKQLQKELGEGFSASSLRDARQFYILFPELMDIHHAVRGESKPGVLNPSISWTHYRALMRVDDPKARSFYEIEATNQGWSARNLERQINSQLFFRLHKSQDKEGLLALASQGQTIAQPIDIIKDPYVLEFLNLPESPQLSETNLETALIDKLHDFLLELGNGFAFIGRQKRLTLEGDHFYPDLVFYHTKLKCYVIIDLKVAKLDHGDLGQMQLYVNYYDKEIAEPDDNPTIGLVLCTDKNDTMVKYVLDKSASPIFASRYQLHLPSEDLLRQELLRELNEVENE
jgi:predicted nuclease of restriction endonuclease-like (RecB) superfamily